MLANNVFALSGVFLCSVLPGVASLSLDLVIPDIVVNLVSGQDGDDGAALHGDHLILNRSGSYWKFNPDTGAPLFEFQSDPADGSLTFNEAVDIDGDTVVMSASAGTFVFDAVTGNQVRKLSTVSGLVAVSGDLAVISDSAAPITLVYNHVTGVLVREITAPGGGGIGGRIDLDGNNLLLSIPNNETYIFDVSTGSVVHELLHPGDVNDSLITGTSVAIEGAYAVVGDICPIDDCTGPAGLANVYDVATGAHLHRIGGGIDLGEHVSVSGDYVLLGGPGSGGRTNSAGSAAVFSLVTGQLIQTFQKVTTTPEWQRELFGGRVQISGNRIVILSLSAAYDAQYAAIYSGSFLPDFSVVDQAFNESDGTVSIEVSLSQPADGPVSVDYSLAGADALPGVDFHASPMAGTLTVPAGQQSAFVEVAIIDDSLVEGTEALGITLSNPVGGDLDGAGASAMIMIEDNEWSSPAGGQAGRLAGFALATAGDRLLAGMPGGNGGTGSASLVGIDAANGLVLPESLVASDAVADDDFGYSAGLSSEFAVVGAPLDDDQGAQSGSVYVFNPATGAELYKINGQDVLTGSRFGISLALEGDRLLAGAHRDDENGTQSGSAHVFRLLGTSAIQTARLLPSDGVAGDHFGLSVDLEGSIAAVGAPRRDDNGDDSGAAYLFDLTGPTQMRKLLAPDGAAGDRFGTAVALSGDRVFVGAPDRAGGGAVYVFQVSTGDHLATLLPESGDERDMGFALDASADLLLVGIPNDDLGGIGQGSAVIYDIAAAPGMRLRKLQAPLTQPGQQTGRAVALGDALAFAGAPYADGEPALIDTGLVLGTGLPLAGSFAAGEAVLDAPAGQQGAGLLRLRFLGTPGTDYREEHAADLQTWVPLETFTATGWIRVRTVDPSAGGGSDAFRFVELP